MALANVATELNVSQKVVSISISVAAVVIATAHVLMPSIAFDTATLILLGMAVVPWLGTIFKSVDVPGVGRVEFQDRKAEVAANLGLAFAKSDGQPAENHAESIAATVNSAVTPQTINQLSHTRVLWVDDKPANNVFERRSLEALGIRFDLSESTNDALEKVRTANYAAIISDMGRAGDPNAGYTLLGKLRSQSVTTPFIIYGGTSAMLRRPEALSKGAYGCTNNPQELFQLVLSATRESQKRR